MSSTSGADNGISGGVAGQQTDPSQGSGSGFEGDDVDSQPTEKPEKTELTEDEKRKEEALIREFWKKYEDARKFDENYRKQIAIDRKYAAGTSDPSWAVSTNLIGAFIDILVALLYARNPDVSVTKAPQVDEEDTASMDLFAKTLQIVISSYWGKSSLKRNARKAVRSVLSNAEGWLKATFVGEKEPQPEVETALNDAKETLARLEAQQKLLEDPEDQDPDTVEAELETKKELIAELEEKIEVAVNAMFVIDFVKSENIQVSMDIDSISDYCDADWIGEEMFIDMEDALSRFPRLDKEDLKSAKKYFQREPKEMTNRDVQGSLPQGQITAESAQAFTTQGSDAQSLSFLRVVEQWDRTTKQITTVIDGVKKWAKEPYAPPYPTSRFYPYFYFSFYEVDGERHPQSLAWRLYKLQDEYSSVRSNFRLTRERSIPGTVFNAAVLDNTEAKKLSDSTFQEYIAIKLSDPSTPLAQVFMAKPTAPIDMRLYDPTLILSDMERISGVQEALSAATSGPGNPKTATEANIQQSGTAARTTSDRDNMELMLTDLAIYTAEQALQCVPVKQAQRIAGPKAFWPVGMDLEDLFTLVEVSIQAGSTGKPKQQSDQQAWATILPLIKQTLVEINQALASGNQPLANAYIELVKETMVRMGDESDPDRFIPRTPPPGTKGSGAPPPPILPTVTVALKGVIDPGTASTLVAPAVARDQMSMQPPPPPPGGGPGPIPAPGAAPAPGLLPQPSPAAPAPGAGAMMPSPHP